MMFPRSSPTFVLLVFSWASVGAFLCFMAATWTDNAGLKKGLTGATVALIIGFFLFILAVVTSDFLS